MAKKKLSSAVQERRKKKANTIPLVNRNRFEVHINRQKHSIVGKKDKNDRGLPGISRSKANKKRKETLLVNYKQRNKSNVMIDKRFGEFDENVSVEEKMLKRFALEKQSHHVKAGHYNLEDDEDLTHFGQSIGEMTTFDEIELGSSDEEEDGGIGGFLSRKEKKSRIQDFNQDDDDGEPKKLTRQEMMNEIIADSKRDKHEKQKTKELAFELTQRLDSEWKDVHNLLVKRNKANDSKDEKQDDYDKIVNELVFEAKGQPTERMKSVEELARIEKEKIAKLERQRKERMEMEDDDEEEKVEQSADALIVKSAKKVDDRYMLQYRDGEMVRPAGFEAGDLLEPQIDEEDQDDDEDGEAGSEDGDDVDEEDDDEEEDEDEEDDDEEDDEDEEEETDNEDVFSDDEIAEKTDEGVEKDEESDDEEDVEEEDETVDKKVKKIKETEKAKVKKEKKSKKKDKVEISYYVPENLEKFLYIVHHSKEDLNSTLQKIRQLNMKDKKKLEKLVDLSFEFIDYACDKPEAYLQHVNKLGGFIQQLSGDVPVHVTNIIKSKLKALMSRIKICKKQKNFNEILPTLNELFLFKIVELVYPTSDLYHLITTPCMLIISLILTKAHFTNMKSVLSGVFLLDVVYSYVKLSKRYLPELVNALVKLFYEAIPEETKLTTLTSSILNMEKKYVGTLCVEKTDVTEIAKVSISKLSSSCETSLLEDDSSKLAILRNLLLITQKFCDLYKDKETFKELFEPVLSLVEALPVECYTQSMKEVHSSLVNSMSSADTQKEPLKLQARKPTPLALLEPQFEEVFNDNLFKKRGGDKAKNEHDKLKYKVKKELKGAVREIRKDTQYLAKQQLKEQLEKDATRKRKVKELKNALENEGRDIKEMAKGGKKSKPK